VGGHISRSSLFYPWQAWERTGVDEREDERQQGEKRNTTEMESDGYGESIDTVDEKRGGDEEGTISGPCDFAGNVFTVQKRDNSAKEASVPQDLSQNEISSSKSLRYVPAIPRQVESSNCSNEYTANGVGGDSYYETLTNYLSLHLNFSSPVKAPSASDIATSTSFSLFHALAQSSPTSETTMTPSTGVSELFADESAANSIETSSNSALPANISAAAIAAKTTYNATQFTKSNPAPAGPAENILTKHVTQRIDARTNYHCFTGNIDAVTGHLIHGTMLHRFTGEVYEGPFYAAVRKGIEVNYSKQYNWNDYSNPGQNGLDEDGDDKNLDSSYYETVSLRHGNYATCRYTNGLKFVGIFEWDRPKSGTWIMAGEWTYEGSVIFVHDSEADYNSCNSFTNGNANEIMNQKAKESKMKQTAGASKNNTTKSHTTRKLIGITVPLPGSVIFHGTGRFIRSDGLVYQGEFFHGLASGVGKELLPNGKGVYHGEFSGGLRHGVGTLIEECEIDEEVAEETIEDCKCRCVCNRSDLHDSDCSSQDDQASAGRQREREVSPSTIHSDGGNSSCHDSINESDCFDSDHGPDFAAGGTHSSNFSEDESTLNDVELNDNVDNTLSRSSNDDHYNNATIDSSSLETKPDSSQNECRCESAYKTQHTRKRRQYYSSGVWCAGQFEIEDSHGTVFPDSNEVIEEWNRAKIGPIVDLSANIVGSKDHCKENHTIVDGDNRSDDHEGQIYQFNTVASLNRTTWDLLPEKWLGLGK